MGTSLSDVALLCRELGRADRDYVILGEGNVSVRTSDNSIHVKASGKEMSTVTADDFVNVELDPVMGLLDDPETDDFAVAQLFDRWSRDSLVPSIESPLHVVCQSTGGARVVAHTHPEAVNALLCSTHAEALVRGSIFPDQVVVLGPHPLMVPYADPGITLARLVRARLEAHIIQFGEPPKVIYLRNHGMFALGDSPLEVLNITAMAVKSARILRDALSIGAVAYLPEEEVERLHVREDEGYRREELLRKASREPITQGQLP